MSFKNIKGQDSAIKILRGEIENNRVAHAYIFLGPSGVGKRMTAVSFAKALNCLDTRGSEPCEACAACRKINNSNHPDVFLVKPEEDGSAVAIDQVRELIRTASLKPYEGRKKVYIIDEADSMKHQAANAILKTLEEPSSDSVIILISENLGMLFSTIVSRCQVVRFFPLGVDTVSEILEKKHGLDKTKAHLVSHISSGKLGAAIEMADGDFLEKRAALVNALAGNRFFEMDFDKTSRENLKVYLDIMLTWYRDILALKVGADPANIINIDRKDAVLNESKRLDLGYLDDAINQIINTSSFLDQNANQKLAMGVLGVKLCTK